MNEDEDEDEARSERKRERGVSIGHMTCIGGKTEYSHRLALARVAACCVLLAIQSMVQLLMPILTPLGVVFVYL